MLLFDALYILAGIVLSPWLLWRAAVTGRYRRKLAEKLLGDVAVANPEQRPVAWFHGVSVGEIHLLVTLVAAFRTWHPNWLVVVSSTTDTGLSEARVKFADCPVIPFPFDFSWAVGRALDVVNPTVIVLTESELWPSFLAAASRRKIPVVVANARLSPRTFARMRPIAGAVRRLLFRHVAAFAAQSEETAGRLRQLGVTRVSTTGNLKFDGANASATGDSLRSLFGYLPRHRVLVAGSTHSPEESILLDVYARLRERFPELRLVLVPRHPDRFGEVAKLIESSGLPFARWMATATPLTDPPAVVLLDTIGKLGDAWAIADVGFTGGSLDGKRGGQSMIEPAGYGVPVCFGPHVWNFRDASRLLVEAGGARVVRNADELERELAAMLGDPDLRAKMCTAARQFVWAQQGATGRTLDIIDSAVSSPV